MQRNKKKSTTGQGDNYTTEWSLDYEYIKNHYRLMAVDSSRQKELMRCWSENNSPNRITWTIKKW